MVHRFIPFAPSLLRCSRSYSTPIRVRKRWPFALLFVSGTGLAASVWLVNPFEKKPLPISPVYFVPLKLIRKEILNENSSLFVLALPENQKPLPNDQSPIKSLHVMQPEIQIQRAYTPLDVKCFDGGEIELVVKRYADGEMSRFMHRQDVGSEIKVRGPVQTWAMDESLKRIVFVRCFSIGVSSTDCLADSWRHRHHTVLSTLAASQHSAEIQA